MLTRLLTGLIAALILPSQVALAEAARSVAVDGFYCGELSDEDQETKLNYIRLGEIMDEATWLGVVRSPTVQPGGPAPSWCLERFSQDVNLATCRQDNPAIESGALRFTVVETLIGEPVRQIEVGPKAGVRVLLNTAYRADRPKAACRQSFVTDIGDAKIYYSPSIVSLDPRREYVLALKPASSSETGVWATAFALIDNPVQVRRSLRQGVKARRDAGVSQ
jgi:hypothetical protein